MSICVRNVLSDNDWHELLVFIRRCQGGRIIDSILFGANDWHELLGSYQEVSGGRRQGIRKVMIQIVGCQK